VFIEFLTYRVRGHVGPNDNIQGTQTDIRPADEIERWTHLDPIRAPGGRHVRGRQLPIAWS